MDGPPEMDRASAARKLQGVLAARMLDLGMAKQIAVLSPSQRRAIIEWQRTARTYDLIQKVARRKVVLEQLPIDIARTVRSTTLDLNQAIKRSALPADLVLYRGIRNLHNTFETGDAKSLQGRVHVDLGFLASSIHAEIALRDFTSSKGALIIIHARRGSQALWVARCGEPRLLWQGEVLFAPETAIIIRFVDDRYELPLLYGEVMM